MKSTSSHTPGHPAAERGEGSEAVGEQRHRTGSRNPSSLGPAPLKMESRWEERCSRTGVHTLVPDIGIRWILPDSILLRIFRAHWTNASSTFSPVSALVSKNISSDAHKTNTDNVATAILKSLSFKLKYTIYSPFSFRWPFKSASWSYNSL